MHPSESHFHSFVHTSDDGSHILGCCLTVYEPITTEQLKSLKNSNLIGDIENIDDVRLYLPKCICIISTWPFVPAFKKFLLSLHVISTSESKIPIERYICNIIDDVPAPPTAGNVDILYYINDTAVV